MTTVETETVSRIEIEQLQAMAWAVAKLLGASFTEKCWDELSREIASAVGASPPTTDEIAVAAFGPARRRLLEIRLVLLIYQMVEQAFDQKASESDLIVLNEGWLRTALQLKLCLWPFWTKGC